MPILQQNIVLMFKFPAPGSGVCANWSLLNTFAFLTVSL